MDNEKWAALNREHILNMATLYPELAERLGAEQVEARPTGSPPQLLSSVVERLRAWSGALDVAPASEITAEQDRERRILSDLVKLCAFLDENAPAVGPAQPALEQAMIDLAPALASGVSAAVLERTTRVIEALPASLAPADEEERGCIALELELGRGVAEAAPELLDLLVSSARDADADEALVSRLDAGVTRAKEALSAHVEQLEAREAAEPGAALWGAEQLEELCARLRLPYGLDELREIAAETQNELQVELRRAAQRTEEEASTSEALARAREQQPVSVEAGLAALRSSIDAACAFLGERVLLTLPAVGNPEIRAMPTALARCSEAPRVVPPPPQEDTGLVLIALPEEEGPLSGFSSPELANLAQRVAFPGEYLARVSALRVAPGVRWLSQLCAGLPGAAAWAADLTGGWSGFAVEMMCERGFASAPVETLVLVEESRRDALLASVDLEVNLGELAPEAALARLVAEAGRTPTQARVEVCQMLRAPLRRAAAMVGTSRLFELRRHAKELWLQSYSPALFHDFVLSAGAVPLCYLVEAIAALQIAAPEER